MQQEMIGEIESNKPEFLVWVAFDNSWLIHPPFDPAIFRWFDEYAGKFYERLALWIRIPMVKQLASGCWR